jgi:ATP-binding cassette subfamily B protein
MSEQTGEKKANERPKFAAQSKERGPGAGGPMGIGRVQEKAVNFFPSLKRLLGELAPEKLKLIVVVLFGAVSVVFNVANPKIMGRATDVIFEGVIGKMLGERLQAAGIDPSTVTLQQAVEMMRQNPELEKYADMISGMKDIVIGQGIDFSKLATVLLTVAGIYLGASLLMFLQSYLLNRVVQRMVYRLRDQVSAKLDRLPLAYFDNQPRGELLSRVTNDIDNIQQTLQQTLSQLLNSVLTLLGVGVMMFTVSWQLALVTLCIIPLSGVFSALIGKRAQRKFVAMWTATGKLNGQVEEAYSGHALVKVFGRRREVDEEFNKTNSQLYEAAFGAQFVSSILMPVNFFIGNVNFVAISVMGGLKVAAGTMLLGDVQAFIQYSRMFTQPISQIASMANLLQSGVASAERVFEVLDAVEQSPDASGALPVPVKGDVRFDDVTFSYTPDQPLISGLDLHAAPGQTIAIVGPTGAGKTTLVNLLMRFYEIQGGAITLDGTDVTTVPRAALRDEFGMVLQDTWLFGGTIRDNIAYGKVGATEDDVLAAAKAAYVDRFVHSLPDGYDTVIDEEGSNISAGEKQLLTIARAFISDPAVLILDEATSSVDTRTEVLVQQALAKLRTGRTSFVIAHRLSTIRGADSILVMEHGAIVEQGNHDALIAAKGPYYNLYMSQFAAAEE